MKKIENYINGTLVYKEKEKFEQKMKKNNEFRQKVMICKNIDFYMKGALLAAESELEMTRKKIDLVAAGFVIDFFKQNNNREIYQEYLSLS